MSRLFGESRSRGLGEGGGVSGGNGNDLRNYYDAQAAYQRTTLTPALNPLDQVLLRSAIGAYEPDVFYEWAPLWQTDKSTDADIALKKAQTTQVYVSLGLLNEQMLAEATVNQLIEDGTYPGLETSLDKYGLLPEQMGEQWQPTAGGGAPQPPRQITSRSDEPDENEVEGSVKLQQGQRSGDVADADAAGVMFVDPEGNLLLTRRVGEDDTHAGEWSIPAGMLEPDEEPMRGAQREAAEEVGYGGDHAIRHLETRNGDGDLTFHTFVQPVREQFQPVLNEEHDEYVWASLGDLPSPLHPGLEATLAARRVTGDAGPQQRDRVGKYARSLGGDTAHGGETTSYRDKLIHALRTTKPDSAEHRSAARRLGVEVGSEQYHDLVDAGPADEPRDFHGRWSSGEGGKAIKGSGPNGRITRSDIDKVRDKAYRKEDKMVGLENSHFEPRKGEEKKHAELRRQMDMLHKHADLLEKHYNRQIKEVARTLSKGVRVSAARAASEAAHDDQTYASAKLIKNMEPLHLAAIKAYTSAEFRPLNRALRGGGGDVGRAKIFSKMLSAALDKLPARGGVSYRGVAMTPKQAAMYKPGKVIQEKGFTSTSASKAVASAFADGDHNVLFVVHGKRGRYVDPISEEEGEKEVLFKGGTKFKIMSNKTNKIGDETTIHLREVG